MIGEIYMHGKWFCTINIIKINWFQLSDNCSVTFIDVDHP